MLSHVCSLSFYLPPLTSVLSLLLPPTFTFAFSLPPTNSFLPPCPSFHLAFLFLSPLSWQIKFPNLEVIFDIGKAEVGQQPVPWLICTLWPECAISKPYVPDLQEQLRPMSLQRFDYLKADFPQTEGSHWTECNTFAQQIEDKPWDIYVLN